MFPHCMERITNKRRSRRVEKKRKNFMRASCPLLQEENEEENAKECTMFNEFDRSIVRLTATQCLWVRIPHTVIVCITSARHGRHRGAITHFDSDALSSLVSVCIRRKLVDGKSVIKWLQRCRFVMIRIQEMAPRLSAKFRVFFQGITLIIIRRDIRRFHSIVMSFSPY